MVAFGREGLLFSPRWKHCSVWVDVATEDRGVDEKGEALLPNLSPTCPPQHIFFNDTRTPRQVFRPSRSIPLQSFGVEGRELRRLENLPHGETRLNGVGGTLLIHEAENGRVDDSAPHRYTICPHFIPHLPFGEVGVTPSTIDEGFGGDAAGEVETAEDGDVTLQHPLIPSQES